MYLFSKSQIVSSGKLYLPYSMRAALALHEGRVLHLSSNNDGENTFQNQVLLSSIPQNQRSDIWNLVVCFNARPGLLARLTEILTDQNIDIIDCAAATRNQNSQLVIDINFDAQSYSSDFDEDSSTRQLYPKLWLQELYTRIVCSFIEEIDFRTDGKPNIYLRKNEVMAKSIINLEHRHQCEIKGGFVTLPRSALDSIRGRFEEKYQNIPPKNSTAGIPRAMVTADPGTRSILATIFYSNTGHVHIRIDCKNIIGSTWRVTQKLTDNGLNIIQHSTRDLAAGQRSLIDCFIHLPVETDKYKSDDVLFRWIKTVLSEDDLDDLDINLRVMIPLSPEEIKTDTGRLE